MTHRIPRRSRLASAIRAGLHPATATALTVSLVLAAGSAQAAIENGSPGKAALRPENLAARDEILFVDAHVVAPERLLIGAKQGVETVILEEGRDGLEQITEVLENRHPVAVHIVAHGENGRLQLGDTWLDAKQLDENVALIRRWFADSEPANKADLLLYACNLAEGVEGVAFIEKLAEIAGADVAASDDLTGHADLDGDWELEVVTGDIEADLAFSEITINEYESTLGDVPETFTVNDTANTEDGECDEECTIRDAVSAANGNNNSPAVDTINFDFSGGGKTAKGGFDNIIYLDEDIEITEPVNIVGLGITELAMDGEGEDRIFDIESAETVTISDMTLRDGSTEEYGGCIYSQDTSVTLDETYFYDCEAEQDGGAVFFYGDGDTLTIRDSFFEDNDAEESGGALFFDDAESSGGGTLLVENSDFLDNYAEEETVNENAGGGAILAYVDETTITIRDSEFRYNDSEEAGGAAVAIIDEGDSVVLIENSAFYENSALEESAGGGAVFVYMEGTEITIRDSEFIDNDAGGYGGGAILLWDSDEGTEASEVFIGNSYFGENYTYGDGGAINFETEYDSTLTIEGSEFIDNYADEDGGALLADGESGDVVIRDSFFAKNGSRDEDGGGASFDELDTVSIYASTFYDNHAEDNAGGIELNQVEDVQIVNSTFSFNETEGEGGAIWAYFSNVYIRHTTIAFNEAESGGGMSAYDEEVVIENSIFSENTAEDGPDLYRDPVDVSYSLISDTAEASINDLGGGNILGSSADLGPLTFIAGVSTPVHIPDPLSPVVNAGDPGFTPPPAFDQRDEPRVLGARTDMGSVEQSADLSATKTDNVTTAVPGGDTITYTIVFTNSGPSADPSVSATDTFPADLSCSWSSVAAGGAAGNTNNAGPANLSDTLSMPVGSTVTYTVTCSIDPGATGTLSNTANVSGSFDPVPGNNSATDNDTLLNPEADLSLTKVAVGAPAAPLLGDVFDYVLEVSNAGPSDATNVVVTDPLPPQLAFVGSDCGMVEGPPGVLTWSVGTLGAGAMVSCTVMVEVVNFSDLLINTASADSDVADTDTGNNNNTSQENGAIPTIPTLGPWGMLLLLLGLGSAGVRRLRRK